MRPADIPGDFVFPRNLKLKVLAWIVGLSLILLIGANRIIWGFTILRM